MHVRGSLCKNVFLGIVSKFKNEFDDVSLTNLRVSILYPPSALQQTTTRAIFGVKFMYRTSFMFQTRNFELPVIKSAHLSMLDILC